jgi:hypothetical protein
VARNCLFRPISAANRLALNLSVPIQVNEGGESERHSPATMRQVPSSIEQRCLRCPLRRRVETPLSLQVVLFTNSKSQHPLVINTGEAEIHGNRASYSARVVILRVQIWSSKYDKVRLPRLCLA